MKVSLLMLFGLANVANAGVYTYPTKSINLSSAMSPSFYTGYNTEEGWTGASMTDPHAVHGIEAADGSLIYCGKALRSESFSNPSAFAVKLSSTGTVLWSWLSSTSGGNACNAVVEIPSTNQVAVVGWRTVGGVGKRSVTVLDLGTGSEAYTTTNFGDSSGSHGAFEMAELSSNGASIVLSGLCKKTNLDEMAFKSYGNVPGGTAIVQKVPVSALQTGAIDWSREFSGYFSAKSARFTPTGSLVVQLYAEAEAKHASAALLNSDGTVSWGPTDYTEHGEGTDLQVSKDGASFFIIGQGGDGEIAGRLTKCSTSTGNREWTKTNSVGGNTKLIFNECWGGVALRDGSGIVVSCGTGIEGDQCGNVSGQDGTDCLAGEGDKRPGAYTRKASNWQSFTYKVDNSGTLLWQRVDSYKCDDCATMDATNFDSTLTSSSAGEWVFERKSGGVGIVTDEEFGFGLLALGGGVDSGGDNGGDNEDDSGGDNGGDNIGGDDEGGGNLIPYIGAGVGLAALGGVFYVWLNRRGMSVKTKMHGMAGKRNARGGHELV